MHSHQHIRTSLYAAFLLAAFALSFTLLPSHAGAAFNATATNPAAPSALSGAAALKHLKQQGTYQALRAAVADTRANAAPDALIGQHVKLTANDGAADDVFGYAVAVSGTTAVIGAPGDDVVAQNQGSVYVYVRSGGGWTQQARLNALDGAAFDNFGASVAIHGETVMVGAHGNNGNKGAVYVFVRNGAAWNQQQKLTAADGVALDYFGYTVALSGETLAAGAYGDDANKGSAYVFIRNGLTWSQQAKLSANDGVAQDRFATAVALSGDTLVAGSGRHDISGKVDQGAAYVFIRSGVTWSQQQKLTAADGAANDLFGSAVALSGDTLVAGAAKDDASKGAAYVFARSGAVWNQQAKLTVGDGAANDQFGNAVAISGVTVVVGAYDADSNGVLGLGAGYVFARNGAAWIQQAKLTAADGTAQDHFGVAVAVADDTVVVGAYEAEVGANLFQGAAYVFTVQGSLAQQQVITAADGGADEYFGYSVAVSGNTAVIAAAYDNIGANQSQGAVYVYVRSGGTPNVTWNLQQKLTAGDGAAQDWFGKGVALSGDTLVAGAPQDTIGAHSQQGSAYVFVRTGAVWSQLQKLTVQLGATGDHFGSAVAMSGETLVLGTNKPNGAIGAAYVYVRSGATWVAQAALTAADVTGADDFGTAVAVSGNTALVGTRRDTIGLNAQQGSVYVFVRNGGVWSQQAKLTAADGGPNDFFGNAVALSGETAVIGASNDTVGANVQQGSAYVFARNGAVWSQQQKLGPADGASADIFGGAVALSGEAIVIGAYGDDGGNSNAGSAYLFVRNGAAWEQRQKLSATNGGADEFFGFAVGISGDTVVIGAANSTVNGNLGQGRAYVFAGAACPALTINPASLANGTVGTSYNATITASGGLAPYDFTVSLGTLPPGLTLSATGLLSGTPVTAGTFSFTITATAATLCSGNRSYTVIVNSNCPAITVNPAVIPAGTFGQAYSQTLTASGGTPGYGFIINVGNLPNGLTLATNGGLSGTPTLAGVFNFTATATDANGCQGLRAYSVTINPSGAGTTDLQFYPLAHPVRLLDTRAGSPGCDAPGAMIAGQTSRTQTAAGRTCDGLSIPANAKALTGNITTVQSGGGYLTLYPSDAAQPNVANSNYTPNQILNNVFTVGLGANDGAFKIFVTSNTNVVVDVTGYYAPPAVGGLYFHPLPKPIRLLETRQGQPGCQATNSQLQSNSTRTQLGITTCDNVTIPAGAQALVGNATTVGPQTGGWLTFYPADAAQPLVASSNFLAGDVMNAPFTVGLSPSGEFKVFTTSTTDLVIDVVGYYSTQMNDTNGQGLLFNSLPAPVRLLDTRAGFSGCYTPGAKMTGGTTYTQPATGACMNIPATAKAVVGSAAVVTPSGGGWLTFGPSSAPLPFVAASNYLTGQIFNRHFIVGLGADGAFKRYSFATTDLVIDLSGYFAP